MSKFEEYKKKDSIVELSDFINVEKNKELPSEDEFSYKYDPDQLMEKYENRNESEEDFEKRTRYYFKDSAFARAKADRYRNISGKDAMLNKYAKMHSNRSASKRKSRAEDAAAAFSAMEMKIYVNNSDDESKLDTVTIYKRREEVMRLRMKGMIAAAKVKGKSDLQEEYLKGRAKLSCLMILKDQLNHLINDAENQKNRTKLNSKLKSLDKEIASAYKSVKKLAVPKMKKEWESTNKINSTRIGEARKDYLAKALVMSEKNAGTLFRLQSMQKYTQNHKWPESIFVTDKRTAPVNYAEAQKRDWNRRYIDAKKKKDQKKLDQLELEALKRFENTKIPDVKTLTNGSVNKVYEENLRTLYEMTKKALPYYKNQIGKDTVAGRYLAHHPYVMKKIEYLEAVDEYLDYELRVNGIEYKEGKYDVESDDRYRYKKDRKGRIRREQVYGSELEKERLIHALGVTYKDLLQTGHYSTEESLKEEEKASAGEVKEKKYVIPADDEDMPGEMENPYQKYVQDKNGEKKYYIPTNDDEDMPEITENPYEKVVVTKEQKEEKKEEKKEEQKEEEVKKQSLFMDSIVAEPVEEKKEEKKEELKKEELKKEENAIFSDDELLEINRVLRKHLPFPEKMFDKLAENVDNLPEDLVDNLKGYNRYDDILNPEFYKAASANWDKLMEETEEVEEIPVAPEEMEYIKELWGVDEKQIKENTKEEKQEKKEQQEEEQNITSPEDFYEESAKKFDDLTTTLDSIVEMEASPEEIERVKERWKEEDEEEKQEKKEQQEEEQNITSPEDFYEASAKKFDDLTATLDNIVEMEASPEEIERVKKGWKEEEQQNKEDAKEEKQEEIKENKYSSMPEEEYDQAMLNVFEEYEKTGVLDEDFTEEFRKRNNIATIDVARTMIDRLVENEKRREEEEKEKEKEKDKASDKEVEELVKKLEEGGSLDDYLEDKEVSDAEKKAEEASDDNDVDQDPELAEILRKIENGEKLDL